MQRPLFVAAVALFVLSCSEAGIQPIDDSKDKLVDDLLTVRGEVCTNSPDDVTFPVKIMIIVDASGSMQFTDPSAKTTTTTYPNITQANAQASCLSACGTTSTPAATCQKICANPANPGRQGAVIALISSAMVSVNSFDGMAVCIAIIFIMSPCTLILPAMKACMAIAWSWSTNIAFAVA